MVYKKRKVKGRSNLRWYDVQWNGNQDFIKLSRLGALRWRREAKRNGAYAVSIRLVSMNDIKIYGLK
jgi:hypothetical protein